MAQPELKLHSLHSSEPIVYTWPLRKTKEYDAAGEIIETIKLVCKDFHELDHVTKNFVLNEVDKTDFESMKKMCDWFNKAVDTHKKLWKGATKPASAKEKAKKDTDVLRHILQQVYNRSVADPEKLNAYKCFTPEVYGETSYDLVRQMIEKIQPTESDVFLDLGSGVGQVVLQMAAATPCAESIGIEKADIPAKYAEAMDVEFKKLLKWYGRKHEPYKLIKGDFLDDKHLEMIKRATIIFVNNFAFGSHVNHQLKLRFADLMDKTRIISSKEFCPLNFRINDRNQSDIGCIMHVTELAKMPGAVSWTETPITFYLHVLDRAKIEHYYFEKGPNKKDSTRRSRSLHGSKTSSSTALSSECNSRDSSLSKHPVGAPALSYGAKSEDEGGSAVASSAVHGPITRRAASERVKQKKDGGSPTSRSLSSPRSNTTLEVTLCPASSVAGSDHHSSSSRSKPSAEHLPHAPAASAPTMSSSAPESPRRKLGRPKSKPRVDREASGTEAKQKHRKPQQMGFGPSKRASTATTAAAFPKAILDKLTQLSDQQTWDMTVLGEVRVLLSAALKLIGSDPDVKDTDCAKFIDKVLPFCFQKIMCHDAIKEWKPEVLECIFACCDLFMELCCLLFTDDRLSVLDVLSYILDPKVSFHQMAASYKSIVVEASAEESENPQAEQPVIYGRPPPTSILGCQKKWLVDLLNKFGQLGGFEKLLTRFQTEPALSIATVASLLRPFVCCIDFIDEDIVAEFVEPAVKMAFKMVDGISDEELKKECSRGDGRENFASASLSYILMISSNNKERKDFALAKLKMISRILQEAPYGGKMNALNDLARILANAESNSLSTVTKSNSMKDEVVIEKETIISWFGEENGLVAILLRGYLHHVQYVERIETVFRFMIKEKNLSLNDLAALWSAQQGGHEMVVKNIHGLLAKLAWEFSAEQLEFIFQCFQTSWRTAGPKEREQLLQLVRKLAEDDKSGSMAQKVLDLLWQLAHSADLSVETVDLALAAHVKILECTCAPDKERQKEVWLSKCIAEILSDQQNWVVPALKQFCAICGLWFEATGHVASCHVSVMHSGHSRFRNDVIRHFQERFHLVVSVTGSLLKYMESVAVHLSKLKEPSIDPETLSVDGRYNHIQQVQERLIFIKYLLTNGQLCLRYQQACDIWNCLVNTLLPFDREEAFNWFAHLMADKPALDSEIEHRFFEEHVVQVKPSSLSAAGFECFENFFKHINIQLLKLVVTRSIGVQLNDFPLIGEDCLWNIITKSSEEIAQRAISLMCNIFSTPSLRLQRSGKLMELHQEFASACLGRLRTSYDSLSNILEHPDAEEYNCHIKREASTEASRILRLLLEYVSAYNDRFPEERVLPPLARSFYGRDIDLLLHFPAQGRQVGDFELSVHDNMTLLSARRFICRQILRQGNSAVANSSASLVESSRTKIELFLNNEPIDAEHDRRLLKELGWHDRLLLTAKLQQANTETCSSSPEASSSDSTSAATPNPEAMLLAETCLPGVLLSQRDGARVDFLLKFSDLSARLGLASLRAACFAVLRQITAGAVMVENVRNSRDNSDAALQNHGFLSESPSRTLYVLEVMCGLLMPACEDQWVETGSCTLRQSILERGFVAYWLDLLVNDDFLAKTDAQIRFQAMTAILRLLKFGLFAVGVARCAGMNALQKCLRRDADLQQAFNNAVPRDRMLRTMCKPLVTSLHKNLHCVQVDRRHIDATIKLLWAAATSNPLIYTESFTLIHEEHKRLWKLPSVVKSSLVPPPNEVVVNGLETLAEMLLLAPTHLESLISETCWKDFLVDLLFANAEEVRFAMENFIVHVTVGSPKVSRPPQLLSKTLDLLFRVLDEVDLENRPCQQYFNVLTRRFILQSDLGCTIGVALEIDSLQQQIDWLKLPKDYTATHFQSYPWDDLLCGRLVLLRELVHLLPPSAKCVLGFSNSGLNLTEVLIDYFVLPASRLYADMKKLHAAAQRAIPCPQATDVSSAISNCEDGDRSMRVPRSNTTIIGAGSCIPVCGSPVSTTAAYDLLVALCSNCLENTERLVQTLVTMYYEDESNAIQDWEYIPPVGLRPTNGFVGLQNGGATCYLNAILQQLFMVPELRTSILSIETGHPFADEDSDSEDAKPSLELRPLLPFASAAESETSEAAPAVKTPSDRKDYNIAILRSMQLIFAHLTGSQLQFYVPRKFWKIFRFSGEPINLRKQHDAVEFMDMVIDSIDEACKAIGVPLICQQVLGGAFADQKISRTCAHRYSTEDAFKHVNIDIRSAGNLTDALADYTRSELLDGANAYFCEKCNAKVDAMKRILFKKLPKVLAIQLKRFDYDWQRNVTEKFNDYFEFSRNLDMEPFTVNGVSKQGEAVVEEDMTESENTGLKYSLCGITVHSGQATDGHYYSFILNRSARGARKWFRFDDGDVTEIRIDDDAELQQHCFGGECQVGAIFINLSVPQRRQKRWWNAYVLFYERIDETNDLCSRISETTLNSGSERNLLMRGIPNPVKRVVHLQNIKVIHQRNQFSAEYFNFVKNLVSANTRAVQAAGQSQEMAEQMDKSAQLTITLALKFLFFTGFHSKKIVKSPFQEWAEVVSNLLKCSAGTRHYFVHELFDVHPDWLARYLLECPNAEVRLTFARILAHLAQFCNQESLPEVVVTSESEGSVTLTTVSDRLLFDILKLIAREVSEYGRHLQQYFGLFHIYATLGVNERIQLIKLNVISKFIRVALAVGPGPPIRYQYPDLGKLFSTVSVLVRCCDISDRCDKPEHSPNPYREHMDDQPPLQVPAEALQILFENTQYVKKLIEDSNVLEENIKLLRFCCWENKNFSLLLLQELLSQLSFASASELRPVLDTLMCVLFISDYLQSSRILMALRGIDGTDNRDRVCGIFEIILRNRANRNKRAYQLIKRLACIFPRIDEAAKILSENGDLKPDWITAVKWLKDEHDRRPFPPSHYGYDSQSTPAVKSNETSSGSSLERTQSVTQTLSTSYGLMQELCASETASQAEDQSICGEADDISDEAQNSASSTISVANNYAITSVGTSSSSAKPPADPEQLDVSTTASVPIAGVSGGRSKPPPYSAVVGPRPMGHSNDFDGIAAPRPVLSEANNNNSADFTFGPGRMSPSLPAAPIIHKQPLVNNATIPSTSAGSVWQSIRSSKSADSLDSATAVNNASLSDDEAATVSGFVPIAGFSESGSMKKAAGRSKRKAGVSSRSSDSAYGSRSPSPKPPKKKSKATASGGARAGKKEKPVKDPNAPKKPSTAYLSWLSENRDSIKEPGMAATEVNKKAGQLWKELGDKSKWEAKANADKERYERQMAEYEKTAQSSAFTSTAKPKAMTKPSRCKTIASVRGAKSKEFVEESDDSSSDGGAASPSPAAEENAGIGRKKKQYKCDVCGRAMFGCSNFNQHVRSHTGERRASCKYCLMLCSDDKARKLHERRHTGVFATLVRRTIKRLATLLLFSGVFDQTRLLGSDPIPLGPSLRSVTYGDKPEVCSQCGEAFPQPAALRKHQTTCGTLAIVKKPRASRMKVRCGCGCGLLFQTDKDMAAYLQRSPTHAQKRAASDDPSPSSSKRHRSTSDCSLLSATNEGGDLGADVGSTGTRVATIVPTYMDEEAVANQKRRAERLEERGAIEYVDRFHAVLPTADQHYVWEHAYAGYWIDFCNVCDELDMRKAEAAKAAADLDEWNSNTFSPESDELERLQKAVDDAVETVRNTEDALMDEADCLLESVDLKKHNDAAWAKHNKRDQTTVRQAAVTKAAKLRDEALEKHREALQDEIEARRAKKPEVSKQDLLRIANRRTVWLIFRPRRPTVAAPKKAPVVIPQAARLLLERTSKVEKLDRKVFWLSRNGGPGAVDNRLLEELLDAMRQRDNWWERRKQRQQEEMLRAEQKREARRKKKQLAPVSVPLVAAAEQESVPAAEAVVAEHSSELSPATVEPPEPTTDNDPPPEIAATGSLASMDEPSPLAMPPSPEPPSAALSTSPLNEELYSLLPASYFVPPEHLPDNFMSTE